MAKIGSFSETFSQCFFNEMNRPVIIQQVVQKNIVPNFYGKRFPAFALVQHDRRKCSRGKFVYPRTLGNSLHIS
jgi:hypothetical protein